MEELLGVQKLMFELLNLFSCTSAICLCLHKVTPDMYIRDGKCAKKGQLYACNEDLLVLEQYV